jgi:predicted membrane-bound spermidine synthase/MFS family permease
LNREGTLGISPPRAGFGTFAGLFLVTLSTLMYETLLTRIFSVTMWYHFAFVAISVALFGMTVGALIVYLMPSHFPVGRTNERLIQSSLLFGVSIVLSFLTQLAIPFVPKWSIAGVYSVATLYFVIAIPFIFSGIFVCLALTRFPQQVSRLYAADLVGAAVGAVALVWLLGMVDAPSAVVVVAILPAVASLWLAQAGKHERMFWLGLFTAALFLGFGFTNALLFARHDPLLRLTWVGKGESVPVYEESSPDYERWNAFSRIRIDRRPGFVPMGWGLSPTLPKDLAVEQFDLVIDSVAYTVLTRYDGNPQQIQHLKYDVTNLGHYARKDADVLVVGVGGGRDILSALAFGQKSVTGVEINDQILHAINDIYGDFTGHLDRDPRVTFVNDEARSYIARSNKRYDIIQLSLTDTWAATSAGAYALSENSLYTVEAWDNFLDHLKPGGLLSVSRFYQLDRPMEAYRLASLAAKTLRERGVTNPRDHIYMAGILPATTILVSSSPLSNEDVAALDEAVKVLKFDRVLTPNYVGDRTIADIVEAEDLDAYVSHFPINISAPTDDSPFFFQMVRLGDLLRNDLPPYRGLTEPVIVLAELTIAVLVMTLLCIILPLLLAPRKANLRRMMPFFVFFAAIGFGFLLVEVSQMQRLIIFLGHPTYGLSVVLFSLLLFSGIGSFATERIARPGLHASNLLPFIPLLLLLIASGFVTPLVVHHWDSATTPVRILAATAILAPMGLAMGMPFPIGMKVVSAWPDAPTPYFWGINGATSVCASVLAVAIALSNGISAAFWTGCICYAVAVAALAVGLLRARS